jgi:subtilisin family serine protease
LWLVVTEDIIVRLTPDIDPKRFFGNKWARVRRVDGTTDQFVLSHSSAAAADVFAEVNRLAADPRVLWAEPDFVAEHARHTNDPLFPAQWTLNNTGQSGGRVGADINAPEAWRFTTGSPDVVIAILDDAVQIDHPDLSGNIFVNAEEIPNNGLDDDGNGYIDDATGWDFRSNDNDPKPVFFDDSHGTLTAGVAAAVADNSTGIAGVAHNSKIMPIRVYGATASARAAALYYAGGRTRDGLGRWRGADVLSISLGWPKSQADFDAMQWVARSGRGGKGCPIFVASGNEGSGWFRVTVAGVTAGVHTFRFEYKKDVSISAAEDTVWLDDVVFPGGERQSFEESFPPGGWISGGAAPWTQETRHDHVRGTGIRSARSGRISHSQSTYLEVTRSVPAGDLTAFTWTSTESFFDVLNVYVDGVLMETDPGGVNSWKNGVLSYPATHPDVLAVGASTDFDYRADYSQFSTNLAFVAPSGGGIGYVYTTDRTGSDGSTNGDYYLRFSGTSASCPIAAGVGALVLSVNPCLTSAEVGAILRDTCDKIGGLNYVTGRNLYYGYGRLNAERAVTNTLPYDPLISVAAWSASATGGTTNVIVAVMGKGCPWYVSNTCSWVSASPLTGKGSGTVKVVARANLDCTPRSCVIEIGGQQLLINQAASSGIFSLSSTNWNPPWVGGSNRVVIRPSGTGCFWSVVNPCTEWLTVNPTSGSDTGAVIILASSNLTTVTRSCDLILAGKRFRVTQGPAAVLNFSRSIVTNRESDRVAVVRVVRTGALKRAVSVDLLTRDGTAVSPEDYRGRTNRLRLASGVAATNVAITLVNDTRDEGNESFDVLLANPASAILGQASTSTVEILDNDLGGFVNFSSTNYSASETGRVARITLLRTAGAASGAAIDFVMHDGTAVDGLDYSNATQTITFAANQVSMSIDVPLLDDALSDSSKDVLLSLRNAAGGLQLGPNSEAVLTVTDDEPALVAGSMDARVVSCSIMRLANGGLAIKVAAPGDSLVRLETSIDLVEWTTVATLTNAVYLIEPAHSGDDFPDRSARFADSHRFYRAVRHPK